VGREQRLDFPPEGGVLPAGFRQEPFAPGRGLLRQRLREYFFNAFVHTVLAIGNQLGPTTPLLVPHSFMRLLLAFSLIWLGIISSGSLAKGSKRQGSAGAVGTAKWGAGVNPGADSGCRGECISVIIFMPPPYAIGTNCVN
jgi:hypothetical protein